MTYHLGGTECFPGPAVLWRKSSFGVDDLTAGPPIQSALALHNSVGDKPDLGPFVVISVAGRESTSGIRFRSIELKRLLEALQSPVFVGRRSGLIAETKGGECRSIGR